MVAHGIGRRGGGVREAEAYSFGTWVAAHIVERRRVNDRRRVWPPDLGLPLALFLFIKKLSYLKLNLQRYSPVPK